MKCEYLEDWREREESVRRVAFYVEADVEDEQVCRQIKDHDV